MKKLFTQLSLLCILLFLSSHWYGANAQAAAYVNEGFENYATSLPTGWSVETEDWYSEGGEWELSADAAYSGNTSIRFGIGYQNSSVTSNLISPQVSASSDTRISFYLKKSSEIPLNILVSTDGTVDNAMQLNAMEISAECNWTKYTYSLSAYAGQGVYVIFQASDWYYGGYIWIDDVKIGSPNTCATPISLSVRSVTQTSATLTWTVDEEGDTSTTYRINLSDAAGNSILNNQTITAMKSYLSYNLSNLTPNTTYSVYLQSDCSSSYHGTSDLSSPITFETLCLPKQVPYSVDFNSESSTATKPGCWMSNPEYSTCASLTDSYKYGLSGKSMKITSTDLRKGYVASPQIECAADSIQVDLWVFTTSYGTPIQFGLMSDIHDYTSCEELKSFTINAESTWTNLRFTFANTQQAGVRNLSVAIIVPEGNANTVYVDNVTISRKPSCLRPENVTVDFIDSTFAQLSWYEDAAINNYVVEVNNIETGAVNYVTATTNPAVISGLTSNNTYQFRVRSVCAANDSSEWSLTTNQFKTKCGSYSLPFSENFDNVTSIPTCWDARLIYRGVGNGFVSNTGWSINIANADYAVTGNSIKSPTSQAGTRYLLTLPSVNIPSGASYDVAFKMYRWFTPTSNANEHVNVYVNSVPSLEGAVRIDSIYNSYSEYPAEYEYEKYYRYRLTIPMTGVVYVMFEAVHDAYKDFYIDDVEIKPSLNCKLAVKNLRWYTLTGDNKVQFKWFSRENETQWAVKYKLSDAVTETVLLQNTVVVNDSVFDLDYSTVANASTRFNVECEVAAYCGANDTSDYEPIALSFITPCAVRELPVIESFEGVAWPSPCWVVTTDYKSPDTNVAWDRTSSSSNYNTIYGQFACRFPTALENTVAYLNSPLVSLEAGVEYKVSFYIKRNYIYYDDKVSTGIYTYVSRHLNTTEGAQYLGFISSDYRQDPVGDWGFNKVEYVFSVPASGNYHIILAALQMNYIDVIVDDIVIEKKVSCTTPALDEFEIQPGVNTAKVIYNGGVATQMDYAVCPERGVLDDIDPNNIVTATIDANNSFVVNNLQPDTKYSIYVRNHCSDGTVSTWMQFPLDVRTMCNPFVVTGETPFIDNFESALPGDNIKDFCYQYENRSNYTYGTDVKLCGGQGALLGESGTDVMPYSGNIQIGFQYGSKHYMSHLVRLFPDVTYEVAIYVHHEGESYSTMSFTRQAEGSTVVDTIMSTITMTADAGYNTWKKVYAYFSVPQEGNYLIGFETELTWDAAYITMDNFSVKEMGCVPPTTIEIVNVTSNNVEFAINSTNSPVEIRLCTEEISEGDVDPVPDYVDTVSVGTTSVIFDNLSPNTTYYYVMRSLCTNALSDWSRPAYFNTRCVAAEIPYNATFENTADARCWSLVGVEGSQLEMSAEQSYAGSSSIKLTSGTAVTPMFNVTSLSNCMVTGYAYSGQSESSAFEIGVMTDVNDVTTFEPILNIVVPTTGQWVEFTAYLDTLNNPDYAEFLNAPYIALASGTENVFYFDNVSVEVIPSCARPANVLATVVDAHTASITWSQGRNINAWEISGYKATKVLSEPLFTQVVNTNSFTVNTLDPITSYKFSVRSICGAGDTSDISYSNEIKTSCAALELPYFVGNFMEQPDCWISDNYFNFNSYYGDAGYYSYMVDLSEVMPSDTAMLSTPEFILNSNNGVVFSVIGFSAVENTDLPLYYTLDGGQTYTLINQSVFTPAPEDGMSDDHRQSNQVVLPNVGPGTIQFAFRGAYSSNYWSEFHVSGFEIEEIDACSRPQNVTFQIQDNSVLVSIYDTIASHSQWEYVIGEGDFDPDTKTPVLVGNVFTIDNLENAKLYNLYVRTACGSEYSNWYKPYILRSPCGPITMPYTIDFESLSSSNDISKECYHYDTENPDKSQLIGGGSPWWRSYPYVEYNQENNMFNSKQGYKSITMVSSFDYPLYFVGPEISDPLNSIIVDFNYVNGSTKASEATNIIFGVMLSDDLDSFEPLYTCPLQAGSVDMNRVSVDLNDYLTPGVDYSGYTIAFKYGPASQNAQSASLDNINIIKKEKCSSAALLTWNNASQNSLGFAINYYADSVEVAYGLSGTAIENCTKLYTTSKNISINSLVPGTGYDVYVRNICANVADEWGAPYYASTLCDTTVIALGSAWVENFDAPAVGNAYRFPTCITRIQTSENDGVVTPLVADTANISAASALVMNDENMIILPLFDNAPSSYQISFYVKGNGSFELGTVNDVDKASFAVLESLKATANYTRRYFDLQNYFTTGNRIAIRSLENSKIIIDSIAVYFNPTCFAPKFLEARNVMDNSATVVFTMSSLTDNYEYYLKSATDSITFNGTGVVDNIALTNLVPNTNYTFGIRTYCENDPNPTAWATTNFSTTNAILRLPAMLDFEDPSHANYVMFGNIQGDNNFVIGNDANAFKGTKALYVTDGSNGYNYATVNSECYAVIPVLVKPGALSISYEVKVVGENQYDFARIFLSPVLSQYSINASLTPDGCIALDGGRQMYNINDWTLKNAQVTFTEEKVMYLYICWKNDYMDSPQPPISIDNISFFIPDCAESIRAKVSKVSYNSAYIGITKPETLKDTIVYDLYFAGSLVSSDTVPVVNGNIFIDGLASEQSYSVNVYGKCDNGLTTGASVTFNTLCNPIIVNQTTPYFEGFENTSYEQEIEELFPCWNISISSMYYVPTTLHSNAASDGLIPYEGTQAMLLRFGTYTFSNTYQLASGSYKFSVRAMRSGTDDNGSVSLLTRADNQIEWNTVLSDNINNNYKEYSTFVTVPEGETAVYEFAYNVDLSSAMFTYAVVDNVSLKYIEIMPPVVAVENIRANSADVTWTSVTDSTHIKLLDGAIELVDTTIVGGVKSLALSNLSAGQTYTVQAYSLKGNGATSDPVEVQFTTDCEIVSNYSDDFESYSEFETPLCWYNDNSDELYYAKQWNAGAMGSRNALIVDASQVDEGVESAILTPYFYIDQAKNLSFDYYNNVPNSSNPDALVVSVIKNGVVVEELLNATYRTTNNQWCSFSQTISNYIGDTIQIRFSHVSTGYGSTCQVAIDNFSLGCTVIGNTYNEVACPNNPYVGHGFNIKALELTTGMNTFTRRFTNTGVGCDTIVTLNVYVPNNDVVELYDTICEGETYISEVFTRGLTTSGHYTATSTSSFGCDSNLVLHLTVVPVNNPITVNICEGQSYNFAGTALTQSGVYTDTAVNRNGCDSITILTLNVAPKFYEETYLMCEGASYMWQNQTILNAGRYEARYHNAYGCDSIRVLNVEVIPTNVTASVELCQGQSYQFGNQTITEAGTYTYTFANSLNCDSIVTLTVTTKPAPVGVLEDYTCEGSGYYSNGFSIENITKDTVVERTTRNIDGCDSIIRVNVKFIPTVYESITVTINEGESYEFAGNTYTQAGTYEGHFYTDLGCDSIVTLTLIVTTPVDNAYALPIIVAPNPVVGGQSTFVNREWTAEEQNGMRVEVLNAVGQVVDVFTPATFPIEVGGIYTSGIYYIRVTSGTGEVYLGRLVVK